MSSPKKLLDVREAAERLGVTHHWVRRKVAERAIPFVKLGGRVLFDPDALDAWIDEHRVPAERS